MYICMHACRYTVGRQEGTGVYTVTVHMCICVNVCISMYVCMYVHVCTGYMLIWFRSIIECTTNTSNFLSLLYNNYVWHMH